MAELSEADAINEIPHFQEARRAHGVERKDIVDAVCIYLGIRKIVEDYSLTALTLRCFDLLEMRGSTGCLALSRLNDAGIPAGCEGDIPALFTMLINRLITGKPAFMANPARVEENCITLAHCTVAMSMVETFDFKTHFESGRGVGIAGKFPEGPVTVSRIGGSLLSQYYVGEGEVVSAPESDELCRTQVTIEMPGSREYFFNNPLGNHHVIGIGSYAERFGQIMEFFDAVSIDELKG